MRKGSAGEVLEYRRADSESGHVTLAPPADISVAIVIPAMNEADNLAVLLPRLPSWVKEVILVDGRSTDGTISVAKNIRPGIKVVLQEGRGKGDALRAGFAQATSDVIVMLDADLSMDPSEIPAFIAALAKGADFAKGSRFIQGGGTLDMSLYRRFGHEFLLLLVRILFHVKYTDLCYGYNAFWTRCLPELGLDADGFEIETLMNLRVLKAGLNVVEVPSFEMPRLHGKSNLRTIPDGLRILRTILKTRFQRVPCSISAGTAEY